MRLMDYVQDMVERLTTIEDHIRNGNPIQSSISQRKKRIYRGIIYLILKSLGFNKISKTCLLIFITINRQCRESMIIATKVRYTMASDPNGYGLSRKHILHEIEQSLKRLQTDYIDLYQVWKHASLA